MTNDSKYLSGKSFKVRWKNKKEIYTSGKSASGFYHKKLIGYSETESEIRTMNGGFFTLEDAEDFVKHLKNTPGYAGWVEIFEDQKQLL